MDNNTNRRRTITSRLNTTLQLSIEMEGEIVYTDYTL